ncbi:hypothetical protein [Staphylococcus capitis]
MNINLLQVINHWYLLIVIVLFIIVVRGGVVYIRENYLKLTHNYFQTKKR